MNSINKNKNQGKIAEALKAFFKNSKSLKRENGALPSYLFGLPILLWGLYFLFFSFSNSSYAMGLNTIVEGKNAINKSSKMARQLQADLVYISSKAKGTNIFSMNKQQIANSTPNEGFLASKAKKQLEQIAATKTKGKYNGKNISFTDSLSVQVNKDTIAQQALNYELDHYKYSNDKTNSPGKNRTVNQNNKADSLRNILKNSGYYVGGELRDTLADNSRSYDAYDNVYDNPYGNPYAGAYSQGVEDYENDYKHSRSYNEYNKEYNNKNRPNKKTSKVTKKIVDDKLSFSTNVGTKDNLKRFKEKETIRPSETDSSIRNVSSVSLPNLNEEMDAPFTPDLSKSIKAVIDQKIKIRSGDKIQIRVLEDTYWKKIWIPRNTILWGLVSVSKNRARISIPSIQLSNEYGQQEIIRTTLVAYDSDGMEGIYIDGTYNNYTRDAISEGLRQGANVGLNAGLGRYSLNLGRRANRNPKVFIPTGYLIMLFDRSALTNTQSFRERQSPYPTPYSDDNIKEMYHPRNEEQN